MTPYPLGLHLPCALLILQALERIDLNQRSHGVPFGSSLGVLVLLSPQPESYSLWHIFDALRPNELVELHVNSHILCLHVLSRELFHGLQGLRGLLLELNPLDSLVQHNGVVSGDWGQFFRHLCKGLDKESFPM